MSIVCVQHLSKKYGKENSEVIALNDVSLTIEKGEFVAIVGSSGSGKSTLLHMIGGVDKPSSGNVRIQNIDITAMNVNESAIFRRKNIGLIYQFYNLISILNVEENIALPLRLDGKAVNEKEMNEILHLLNLEDRRTHLPSELSGGQQQRVAIGRTLISKPKIILADEPTGNLDRANGMEILNHLKQIHQKDKQTILLVTHDMEIAKQASRILTMEDGKIIKDEVISREGID